MIEAAKKAGAQAVKFQYFSRRNLVTEAYLDDLERGTVKLENVDGWKTPEMNLHDVRAQVDAFTLSGEEIAALRDLCRRTGIDFGCTPVDEEGIEFLKRIGADFLKIASMDADNPAMLAAAARSQMPLVVSTGMADLSEIDRAWRLLSAAGVSNLAMLHCVSIYPPRDEIVNLRFMKTMMRLFDCEIGYSDHTLGCGITLAAVALGARVIEKHFTLDKNMPGWDHKVSADRDELTFICGEGERIRRALGERYKRISPEETEKRDKFRRSITTARRIERGRVIRREDLTFKRPGTGIRPEQVDFVAGRRASRDLEEDRTLTFEDIL
jgi:N-acetylneuraminate synthase